MTRLRPMACLHSYVSAFFLLFCLTQANGQISEIVTDFNGLWRSGRPTISTTRPDNSHNLLAFKYDNIYYSTGVNNTTLTANGISFTPGDYRALPIGNLPVPPTVGTFAGLGQLYDGVDNGASVPPPANNLPFYLTDGLKGLNLGTAIYNLPTSTLRFDVSNFQLNKVGDNIPDVLITQMGAIETSNIDILYFSNANGDTIGKSLALRFSGLDTLALGIFDFYTADKNPMTLNQAKSARAIRFYAADLSLFELNSTNIANIRYFNHRLSGASDIAFVAYNADAIKIQSDAKPGCLSTIPSIWAKAGEGANTITNNETVNRWQERSPNAFSLVQTTLAQQPKFKSGINTGFNFNPYLDFDASNRLLSVNSSFGSETSNADFFVVGRPSATATGKNKVLGFSKTASDGTAQGTYPALSYGATGASVLDNTSNATTLTGTSATTSYTYLWQANYTNGSAIKFFRNGAPDGTGSTAGNVGNYSFQLGDAAPGDGNGDFDVAEILVYPQNLTTLQRNQVETYLAIKYGLPLAHDYTNGTGGTLWNISTNTGYNNNIFGIGREDCQSLHQKQSKSQAADALVTIGNTEITTENNTNLNTLTNATYSLMGDNAGSLAWQTTEKPGKIDQRIGREWKVQETGTVGTLLLQVPASSSTATTKLPDPINCKMFLLVDNDGDFSSGTIAQVEMTLNGTNWETSYNFADGNYFTFATENRDYSDLPATWPTASAGVSGCDVNKDGLYNRNDNNGTKLLVWAGTSVTSETTANLTNSDAADDGLQAVSSTLVANAANQFNVLLNSNTTGTTVYYRLWFDWNNDGDFSNDDGVDVNTLAIVPATYFGSAVVTSSGPTTVVVNVRPPVTFSLQYKTRLIVSDAPITDMYRSSSSTYQFVLSNGEVEDYNAIIILPVTLKSFTAAPQRCNALLQWQTASEQNTSRFEVEHSSDGQTFMPIASVAAKNTATGATYQFFTNPLTAGSNQFFTNPLTAGSNYFRLKMIDKDEKWAYSTVAIAKGDCNTTTRVMISPNPAKENLYVSNLPAQAQLIVTDATGRSLVSQKTGTASAATLSLSGWAAGVYHLQILVNGKRMETYKFLKAD